MFEILDRKIRAAIMRINNGKETPFQSGAANMINRLKNIDEPAYDELMAKYKTAVNDYKVREEKKNKK